MQDGGMCVVLGPGFAPGLASLGVLAELEERNVPIRRVIGVNTGALAAALWAVGSDLELAARVLASLPWPSYAVARDLAQADPLLSALNVLTRGASFHEVKGALTIVAADEATAEPVSIEEGSIAWAVRCSLAVPGLFHPLERSGRRLVDGGCVWSSQLKAVRDERRLVVTHRSFASTDDATANGFAALHVQLAHLASRSWDKEASTADEGIFVTSEVGGLLDFHRAQEWFEAGRRAFRQWLLPQDGSVGV